MKTNMGTLLSAAGGAAAGAIGTNMLVDKFANKATTADLEAAQSMKNPDGQMFLAEAALKDLKAKIPNEQATPNEDGRTTKTPPLVKSSEKVIHSGLKGIVDTVKAPEFRTAHTGECGMLTGNWPVNVVSGCYSYDDARSALDEAEAKLKKIKDTKEGDVGGFLADNSSALTVGGGLLGAYTAGSIAMDLIERNNEINAAKAGDSAVAEWFNNVGSKIQCTVGGKVVGSYGDPIELK
jgi:hypothetical protein